VIVAISQSGTTTDTNRTVDLARARGAIVIAIVNRRQSDLVDKADGVLYTSDGRDVEMAVASTKAFYAQIAAGTLLALALAERAGGVDHTGAHELLAALRALPDAMRDVIARRDVVAEIVHRHVPSRRYWAVVGNGANRVAASEVRIKLSELCYKSIACDVTEDKKHIDLSAEPLIVVCAAGLSGSNADDVAKELAIYRAHKAAPIVVASHGETRFGAALDTIFVPAVHPQLDFVLAAMAGHIFGYEAALAIDASARPLRTARAAIDSLLAAEPSGDDLVASLPRVLATPASEFFGTLQANGYDGALEAATAVRLATLLRYAVGIVPLETYQIELGKVGTPTVLVDDLVAALTRGIGELTRPVDAIKHQAKTVTVGISRSDETLLRVRLVQDVLASGCPRDSLSYRALRTLVELDAAVDDVVGFTRYRIEGDLASGATIHVVDRGGAAASIASRTDRDPTLRGTKHRAAFEREVTVVRGRADGRTVIHVPEVKDGQTIGLTLLHVRFFDRLASDVARRVLSGYRGRYAAIQDQVTETEPAMRDDVLATIDVIDLLTEPVVALAEYWRANGHIA
jgi:glucosamine--fructose-6-phosphate aminotransferase (isomerizing)